MSPPRHPTEYAPLDVADAMASCAWPPLPDDTGAQLLTMQFQFERSQWWSAEALHAAQDRQLDVLLAHAGRTVPAYRERWRAAGLDPARVTAADFDALPIVERRNFATGTAAFESEACPSQHGDVYQDSTSGSLGMPLRFKATRLHAFFWHAFVLRDHLWHRRDLGAKLAQIRYGVDEGDNRGWGGLLGHAARSGASAVLPIVTDVGRQLDWLVAQAPAYLLTYPSNLRALLTLARSKGVQLPSLRELRTFGETLPADLPVLASDVWRVPVTDAYSSQECGFIALQCPDGDGYHAMAESLRVEVLREDGEPCAPGETGRVVITTLHNFAMPLIRYAIGDHAEVAGPCACGRGLPHLSRIMGRTRNMIRTPDGRHLWPIFGILAWIEEIPVRQIQFVQQRVGCLEVRYVMDRELTEGERKTIAERLNQSLGWSFELDWRRCHEIPAGPTGKFEDVLCLLPEDPDPR